MTDLSAKIADFGTRAVLKLSGKPYPPRFSYPLFNMQVSVLRKHFAQICAQEVEKIAAMPETAKPFADNSKAPIWVCWLQGEREMPENLKPYIATIQKNRGAHPLYFLDLPDAQSLVEIPQIILESVENGRISRAHLADYIRICILEKFGGIWLDTTIILDSPLPDSIFDYPFWSVKNLDFFPYSPVIPGGLQWQIYAIASCRDALFYKALRRLFEFYVRSETGKINYFFVYYLSEILRERVPILREEYAQVKPNNAACEQIQPFLSGWQQVCRRNPNEVFGSNAADTGTFLYKMSSQIDLTDVSEVSLADVNQMTVNLTNVNSADDESSRDENSRKAYVKKRFLTAKYDSSAYSAISDLKLTNNPTAENPTENTLTGKKDFSG